VRLVEHGRLCLLGQSLIANCNRSVQLTHWDPAAKSRDAIQDASQPADVILFLASDAARGVNGAIVPVDNAWSVI